MSALTPPHIMQRLPTELISLVIERLRMSDAKRLSLVDKEWRELCMPRIFRSIKLWWGKKTPLSQQALDACHHFVIHVNSFGHNAFKWEEYVDQLTSMVPLASNLQSVSLTMLDCDGGPFGPPRPWTKAQHALLRRFFTLFVNHPGGPKLHQLRLSSDRRWEETVLPLGLEPVCVRFIRDMLDAGMPISAQLHLTVDRLNKEEILAASGLLSAHCTRFRFICPTEIDWEEGCAVGEPFLPILNLAICKRITIDQADLREEGYYGVQAHNLMLDRVPTLEILEVNECDVGPEMARAMPLHKSDTALHHLRVIKWEGNLFIKWLQTRKELTGLEFVNVACDLTHLDTAGLASALSSCSTPSLKTVTLSEVGWNGSVAPGSDGDDCRKELADLAIEFGQRGVQLRVNYVKHAGSSYTRPSNLRSLPEDSDDDSI